MARARALAEGRQRDGKAVLYVRNDPLAVSEAQILTQNLEAIGLEVETTTFPGQLLFERLAVPGEPYDLALAAIGAFTNDPFDKIDLLFHGRGVGNPFFRNWSNFNSPKYNRLLDEAAPLSGPVRYRAYGELDVQLSRDAAPAVPFAVFNEFTFVYAWVGWVVSTPFST